MRYMSRSLYSRLKKSLRTRRKARAWKEKCRKAFEDAQIDSKKIFFCTFAGRQYSDSPKAIYERMLNDEAFADYTFVWSFIRPRDYEDVQALRDDRTILVKQNSAEFLRELYSSKYWILNYKTTDAYLKRDNQIFVQCWHGTPLKRLGRDIAVEGNAATALGKIHDSYLEESRKFDYFISPSRFASERFVSSFGLRELGKEEIILEVGYPRNDALARVTPTKVLEVKEGLGIPLDKKVILYCPTFRDNQYRAGVGHTYQLGINLLRMREELGDECVVLMRLHYLVSNSIDIGQFQGFAFDVSHYDDVNDLYAVSDLLVTDYSSVFFDYALLNRPIVFYMYDLDEYRSEIRDFYLDLDDLPGPIFTDEKELIAHLQTDAAWHVGNEAKYLSFCKKYNYLDDGDASKRVIEGVFQDEGI